MTRIARIDMNRLHFTTIPDQRVTAISAALDVQRANRRTATDDLDRGTAERNIADLETALERANVNLKAHSAHMAKLEAERTAQRDESAKRALDAQVDQLRRSYLSMPGATEQEFNEVLPDLLKEQRKQAALSGNTEFQRQLAEAKQRIGNLF